jgi:hypothetical protein
MSKPLLYFDVDGVVNVFEYKYEENVAVEQEFSVTVSIDDETRELPVRVPKGTTDRVRMLEERFEVVWATSWGQHAPEQLSPRVGFGADWRVITFDYTLSHDLMMGVRKFSEPFTEKLATLLHDADDRAFAWADDVLWPDAIKVLGRRDREVAPTSFVKTNEWTGLTDAHVKQLLAFADRVSVCS